MPQVYFADPAPRLLPVLSELRMEVRALSRHAHRLAQKSVREGGNGADGYHRRLSALFDDWLASGDARTRVVAFASAAEFGMDLRKHAEACRQSAMRDGCHAVRALFWTALRRSPSRWDLN